MHGPVSLWRVLRYTFLMKLRGKAFVAALAVLVALAAYKTAYLVKEPGEDKECDPLTPLHATTDKPTDITLKTAPFTWVQKGGVLNDASCLDETSVTGVVAVWTEDDVRSALAYARENNKKVSVAGVKHSMGGHAFAPQAVVLDMLNFRSVVVNDDAMTMTVQSGATWHDIQKKLHPRYAVKAMQSTDIFSVGGSISVNAHGMDHQAGAVENSIRWIRVMRPSGDIVRVSRTENAELYRLVVGGYGLFGVILDAELEIVPNDIYQSGRSIIGYKDFPKFFDEEIEPDERTGLMYTHLSTAPGDSFLDEAIVYRYVRSDAEIEPSELQPLGEVSSVKLRRFVMNLSKYGGFFQTARWWTEKYIEPKIESCSVSRQQAQGMGEACLVARNEPMHDSVPYLKNSLKRETDILHEYFVPRENLTAFIDGMRDIMRANDTNLLNASIRVVLKERGYLTYAPKEAFSVVLYINQTTDEQGNRAMKKTTQELIDLAIKLDGRFFLPYQLHYTKEQLRASYPEIDAFFSLKKQYDPDELLTNTWYETYAKS